MWQQLAKIGLLQLSLALSVCLVGGQSAAASGSFNATLTCSMVQNGTFLKDPTACDTWIQCVDDEPVYGACSTGLFYDLSTNECVDPSAIKCYSTQPCATILTNGFVADPYSCNGYYYCYNGNGVRGECSPGMNFNPGTQDCIRNFACTLVDPDSWCNIVPELVFISDLQSCQAYHLCWNGTLENGTCADGYYFDAFDGVCGYEADVKCNVPPLHPDLPGEGICTTAGEFVSDNETCAGYYYCQEADSGDFVLIWGQCPAGRFFDAADGGECVDRRQVVCDYSRCDGMGATSIQLANAPNDGCRGYLLCQDDEEIGSGFCPDGEAYFNEVTQRCTSDVVNYPACATVVSTTTAATTAATTATTTAATTATTTATSVASLSSVTAASTVSE